MTFPDDDNGDVLRRMFEGGDSLKQARDIDFAHRFVHGRAAETFAALASKSVFKRSKTLPRRRGT